MKTQLDANDFMMMDVHRPMTADDIAEHPAAAVDRSLRAVEVEPVEPEPVEADRKRYRGPFVTYPDNVAVADVATSQPLGVDRVLQSAFDNKLHTVIVVGVGDHGLYMLCSEPDIATANLLLDRGKRYLLDAIDGTVRGEPDGEA